MKITKKNLEGKYEQCQKLLENSNDAIEAYKNHNSRLVQSLDNKCHEIEALQHRLSKAIPYDKAKYLEQTNQALFKEVQKLSTQLRSYQFDEVAKQLDEIKNDAVNHPAHYTDGKIEVITFIQDKKLGFNLGNAVKYISRAGKKDPAKTIEDLEKAIWYIKNYIEVLKDEGKN